MKITQVNRTISVTSPLGNDVLLFHEMNVQEQLGRLFKFDLNLLSTNSEIVLSDILGQNITIHYQRYDGENRFFNGFVCKFSQEGMHNNLFSYRAIVRPWFWFLTRTSDCRIFQNKTVPDIIKKIFRDEGFSDFEDMLSGTYKEWENCVQYRETDFNFISRLMEQEGIYYYFKHDETKHTLVLSDSVIAHDTVAGYENVPFYPPEQSEKRERDHISNWSLNQEIQPGSYALNDFDFKKPKANLNAMSEAPRDHLQANYEMYDYPGEYSSSGEGEGYARARIEELQAQYEEVTGHGNVAGLSAGCLFSLTGYPRDDQNREYLIVSASYQLGPQEYESVTHRDYESATHQNNDAIFSCKLIAIDKQQAYRAPRTTPKPIVQGPQTAIVVGKNGEEIWTDKYGRVKVQFHWDRYGEENENSSCWMRVSQVHAGKGFGGIDIPRIGEEVIVSCLEGDPDQPIITGRVYNNDNKPPTDLPAAGMVSGLKSNSTPGGGGYNEMVMDDTSGDEKITIHGQFNMDTTVENDQTLNVNNNRITTITADNSLSVGNDETVSIGNNRIETVGLNETINIGSNRTVIIGSNKSETITISKAETIGAAKALTIGGAYQVTVGAAMNETVGGLKAEEIGALKSVYVGTNSIEKIGTDKSVDAGGNIFEHAGKDISLTSEKNMTLSTDNNFTLKVKKKAVIKIADELTILIGKANIVIKKNGDISFSGNKITFKASGDIVMKGKNIIQN